MMKIQMTIVLTKDNILVFPARTTILEGFLLPFVAH